MFLTLHLSWQAFQSSWSNTSVGDLPKKPGVYTDLCLSHPPRKFAMGSLGLSLLFKHVCQWKKHMFYYYLYNNLFVYDTVFFSRKTNSTQVHPQFPQFMSRIEFFIFTCARVQHVITEREFFEKWALSCEADIFMIVSKCWKPPEPVIIVIHRILQRGLSHAQWAFSRVTGKMRWDLQYGLVHLH